MVKCEFCNTEFEQQSSLNRHLTTARFCIKMQRENGREVHEKLFECNYCHKKLTSKARLAYHDNICKEKQNFDEKDQRIKKLEQDILELSEKFKKTLLEVKINMKKLGKQLNIFNQVEPEKYKKVRVPKSMKMSVWYTYVGREVGVQKCMCCETHEITQGEFECAHVIAEKKGGPNTIENLRPICSTCNKSMRTMNLFEYKEKYHRLVEPVGE